MAKLLSPQGVPVLRQLGIKQVELAGPLAAPIGGILPDAGGIMALAVGGQTRVEAAAVAFVAAHIQQAGMPARGCLDLIDDAVDIAETLIERIDARRKKEGAGDASG